MTKFIPWAIALVCIIGWFSSCSQRTHLTEQYQTRAETDSSHIAALSNDSTLTHARVTVLTATNDSLRAALVQPIPASAAIKPTKLTMNKVRKK